MQRTITNPTTHRTTPKQAHRARTAAGKNWQGERMPGNVRRNRDTLTARGKAEPEEGALHEEMKVAYIDFINRLMHRMKMDGVERMLDTALEQEIN